jgi:hypothetical protein
MLEGMQVQLAEVRELEELFAPRDMRAASGNTARVIVIRACR